MKIKSLLVAGCLAIIIAAAGFVACDKKNSADDINSGTIVDPDGTEYYSIVGTWKTTSIDYYGYNETVIIRLNTDHTGTYTYTEEGYGTTVYNLHYNYDQKACTGDLLMSVPGYSETYPLDFKAKWYGPNTVAIYTRDPDEYYYGYDEWWSWGVFERQ